MTSRYRSTEKISVTFTLTPSASALVIADRPSWVAGILTSRFGRSTAFHRSRASARVASVSRASSGLTSSDTRPSMPPVCSQVPENTSQACWTSATVTSRTVSSIDAPRAASSRTCASYACPFASADAKIVGLVVTPTTLLSVISSCRLPVVSRSRDRSSSQMDTPAADSAASFSLGAMSGSSRWGDLGKGSDDRGRDAVEAGAGGGHDVLGGEAELAEQGLVVRAGAVVLDGDDLACVADPAVPRHRDPGLDRDARLDRRRQHRVAVGLVLSCEPVHARHRHDAGRDAVALEHLAGVDGVLQLRAGADQDELRLAVRGVLQDVAAAGHTLGGGALEYGDVLPGQGDALGTLRVLQHRLPGVRGLVRVAGAQHREVRDRPQRGHVLDRLVGGAVLAEADRVVRPHVDDRGLHHGGQADRAAHVVAEGQERAAVGAGGAVQGDAVEDRAHG